MVKRNKLITTGTLFIVLLLSITMAFNPVVSADESMANENSSPRFISFNSYITIDYDTTPLDQNLDIDQSINVPLTISYATDVPEGFLKFIPFWQIRNIILYGSMIGPMQQITLEVLRKPDWADITLSQRDILVGIPFQGSPTSEKTSLVLAPYEEAPAQPYTITIKASSKQIGRINSFSTEVDIVFTPSFVPTVTIIPDKPTRTVGPQESVNFNIRVKNEANKKARITPQLVTSASDWSPTINPPFFDVLPGGEESFVFSVYTPYDFGWHNEIQSFQVDFTTQIFPLREDAAKGGPYSIFLRINNYGFSTPGFELLPILAALGLAGVMFGKKYRDKK